MRATIEHMLDEISVEVWSQLEIVVPCQTAGIYGIDHELCYEGIGAK
jgi:hypothetical protein